ncbi:MarR family winged helix-turn-helix transcriptional regulator [[Clostridium] dakarense]|uniref:MarR family winged helix-turn-helix transcriptional regulator n=1 Tax=Faecalimicrobium dakarense TaxID=1301100 RepID=UPI0006946DA4|nr:MarR family transcriptional regulator [[Clostridium] dakarense]
MSILDNMGSISQKKLSTLLDIRSTSLSELLFKLEKKGFVERTRSAEDKRTFLISLTKEGLDEVKKHRKSRIKSHTEIVTPLSDDEKQQFTYILSKIKDYYTELGDDENE